jgi:hypothetical protein
MAFGGAGSFLSPTLARELEPHLETCIVNGTIDTGDGLLRDCVYSHSRTKLTLVPGLNQHDIMGDMAGYYEGGPRPVSVHHWKSWYHEPMPQMASISTICGDCFLARWRFDDDNTILTNGYSAVNYPEGINSIDFSHTEMTWDHDGHDYDFSYGPFRPHLRREQKKSYKMVDAYFSETDGKFHQIYVYKADPRRQETMDEVLEVSWPRSS